MARKHPLPRQTAVKEASELVALHRRLVYELRPEHGSIHRIAERYVGLLAKALQLGPGEIEVTLIHRHPGTAPIWFHGGPHDKGARSWTRDGVTHERGPPLAWRPRWSGHPWSRAVDARLPVAVIWDGEGFAEILPQGATVAYSGSGHDPRPAGRDLFAHTTPWANVDFHAALLDLIRMDGYCLNKRPRDWSILQWNEAPVALLARASLEYDPRWAQGAWVDPEFYDENPTYKATACPRSLSKMDPRDAVRVARKVNRANKKPIEEWHYARSVRDVLGDAPHPPVSWVRETYKAARKRRLPFGFEQVPLRILLEDRFQAPKLTLQRVLAHYAMLHPDGPRLKPVQAAEYLDGTPDMMRHHRHRWRKPYQSKKEKTR